MELLHPALLVNSALEAVPMSGLSAGIVRYKVALTAISKEHLSARGAVHGAAGFGMERGWVDDLPVRISSSLCGVQRGGSAMWLTG